MLDDFALSDILYRERVKRYGKLYRLTVCSSDNRGYPYHARFNNLNLLTLQYIGSVTFSVAFKQT